MKTKLQPEQPALPAGVLESDLKYPKWDAKDQLARDETGIWSFELWYATGLGWVIPTLLIAHSRRADRADRTYATTLEGKACRVGKGPHITRQVLVYVRESRKEALRKFMELKRSGQITSNQIRDRISSRRAQGNVMRAQGRTSWLWND